MALKSFHPKDLSLDRINPRFGLTEAADEDEALFILAEKSNLKELWDSISERGYENFEPLVATKEDGEIVVLEGNRRLAAVKCLLKKEILPPNLARRVPTLPADKLATCKEILVYVVKDRKEAAGYIGFKHVNGPARWSSIAKAKFGVDFYESMSGILDPQQRMLSLTRQLGDSRGLIIRLLVAYKIVLQSIGLGLFESLGIDSDEIEFSHLYTMLNNPESRSFIGLSKAPLSESLIVAEPVPATHHTQLKELLNLLYGPKSVIRSQGTDRPRLQRVLASSEGLKELRATGSLASAEAVAGIRSEDWLSDLAKVAGLMSQVNTNIATVIDELDTESVEQARSFLKRLSLHVRQTASALPEN